jgi:hypothetical protein
MNLRAGGGPRVRRGPPGTQKERRRGTVLGHSVLHPTTHPTDPNRDGRRECRVPGLARYASLQDRRARAMRSAELGAPVTGARHLAMADRELFWLKVRAALVLVAIVAGLLFTTLGVERYRRKSERRTQELQRAIEEGEAQTVEDQRLIIEKIREKSAQPQD